MATTTCIRLPELGDPHVVRVIGGVTIEGFDLIGQIQPALSPLVPVIRLIEAVISLYDALKAVPSLSPSSILKALKKAAQKLAEIFGLIPQLSLPYMVKDVCDLLIDTLRSLQLALIRLQSEASQIDAARVRSEELGNPPTLAAAIDCSEINLSIEYENQMSTLQAAGSLLAILGLFASILGMGDVVPDLSDLSGLALDDTIEQIDNVIKLLEFFRDAIPLP